VYISTSGGRFLAGVAGVPQMDINQHVQQLVAAGPNVIAPERAASLQRACMNTQCNARDAELRQCSRCKGVFYCSAARALVTSSHLSKIACSASFTYQSNRRTVSSCIKVSHLLAMK
jgi:hypothetical protein